MLYIGGGVIASGAHSEVLALAEKANLPTTFTLMGIGGFPGDHPLSLGMLGLHGTAYANYAVARADLLIAVGARFDDRVTCRVEGFAKEATIVHIDVDASEIGKIVRGGHPRRRRREERPSGSLAPRGGETARSMANPSGRVERGVPLALPHPARRDRSSTGDRRALPGDPGEAICTADVGQHQMWLAQFYPFRHPRSHISSGGLGTMGFGFPAAIGAKLASPHRSVWSIVGDGGFQMSLGELATVASHRIPVKIAVLNNSSLGMVRQIQELSYDRRYIAVDMRDNPDFVMIANGFGVPARRVHDPAELRPALEWAERYDGPILLDVRIDEEANVFPMVPPGAALDEMIGTRGYLEPEEMPGE